jgi:hypothetical protein
VGAPVEIDGNVVMTNPNSISTSLYRRRMAIAMLAIPALVGCGQNETLGPVANAESAKSIRTALASGSKASDAATAASTGTGWATLRGQFTLDGQAPARLPYNVTKDPQACTEGGRPPLQETLVVQSGTNGIKNVAIYLRRPSRVHESLLSGAEPLLFDQKICTFLPHVIATQVGRVVHMKNSDPVGHNVNIVGGTNEIIEAGMTRDYKPQKETPLPQQVTCNIHPWMIAWFLPRANPYIAITAEDGTFEIANLPAGEELEFQVWHENATGVSGTLDPSTPETRAMKWTRQGRFKLKLQPDEVKELPIVVPASAFKGE